jgi:hypothetical protein
MTTRRTVTRSTHGLRCFWDGQRVADAPSVRVAMHTLDDYALTAELGGTRRRIVDTGPGSYVAVWGNRVLGQAASPAEAQGLLDKEAFRLEEQGILGNVFWHLEMPAVEQLDYLDEAERDWIEQAVADDVTALV